MRAIAAVIGLVLVFMLGAWVDHSYDWPYGYFGVGTASSRAALSPAPAPAPAPAQTDASPAQPFGTPTGNTAVPHYSNAQGLQDAPRNDTAQGAATDFQRCVNTMMLRRESESEARTVCQKIIAGISH